MGFFRHLLNAHSALTLGSLMLTASAVSAASFPPKQQDVTVVQSKNYPGVSISYKETQICETTPNVKGYSGHVHLPRAPSEGRNYEVHTYFWFFEARKGPQSAPLSIWLQGGPGVPSITAALGENGPCEVASDSKSTYLNKWSWTNEVNMLYIDQPVQAGFSYDRLVNGTVNEIKSPFFVTPGDFTKGTPQTNETFFTGTFASQDRFSTANTTDQAAIAMWHMMQAWMQDFPKYKSSTNKFSIWGESYAGHWVPTFAEYFEKQSDLVKSKNTNGSVSSSDIELRLDTVGLVNACIDAETQLPLYPEFAVNNTYGIKAINETAYQSAVAAVPQCLNLTRQCRDLGDRLDPKGLGNNEQVNKLCAGAYQYCFSQLSGAYGKSGRNLFDITAPVLESFPPKWPAGWLNSAEVQLALGVAQNWTGASAPVMGIFEATGDFLRGHNLAHLGSLLDRGVKVSMVYGDADYQCNWLGGEKISLAIKSSKYSSKFSAAGYTNIQTNASYIGGSVRQVGNLSFSRVYDAGHEAPFYQPETAYQIFNRVMFNKDVATGQSPSAQASTVGPSSVFSITNKTPHHETPLCYVWDIMETCDQGQVAILSNGSAITRDFVLIGHRLAGGTEVIYGRNSTPGNGSAGADQTKRGAAAAERMASTAMVLIVPLVAATYSLIG